MREAAQAEILEACEDPECFERLIMLQITPEQLLSEYASIAKGRRGSVRR